MFGKKKKADRDKNFPAYMGVLDKHLMDYKVPPDEADAIRNFVQKYSETNNTVPYRKVAEMINKVEQMV